MERRFINHAKDSRSSWPSGVLSNWTVISTVNIISSCYKNSAYSRTCTSCTIRVICQSTCIAGYTVSVTCYAFESNFWSTISCRTCTIANSLWFYSSTVCTFWAEIARAFITLTIMTKMTVRPGAGLTFKLVYAWLSIAATMTSCAICRLIKWEIHNSVTASHKACLGGTLATRIYLVSRIWCLVDVFNPDTVHKTGKQVSVCALISSSLCTN